MVEVPSVPVLAAAEPEEQVVLYGGEGSPGATGLEEIFLSYFSESRTKPKLLRS